VLVLVIVLVIDRKYDMRLFAQPFPLFNWLVVPKRGAFWDVFDWNYDYDYDYDYVHEHEHEIAQMEERT